MTFAYKLIPLKFPSALSFEIQALNSYCNTVNVSAVHQVPSARRCVPLIKQNPKGTSIERASPS